MVLSELDVLDPSLLKSLNGSVFLQDFKHFPTESKKQLRFPDVSDFQVASLFYPFVRILQIFGHISVAVRKNGSEIYYDFKIRSFNFLYCWMTAGCVTFFYYVFIMNRETYSDWPLRMYD